MRVVVVVMVMPLKGRGRVLGSKRWLQENVSMFGSFFWW